MAYRACAAWHKISARHIHFWHSTPLWHPNCLHGIRCLNPKTPARAVQLMPCNTILCHAASAVQHMSCGYAMWQCAAWHMGCHADETYAMWQCAAWHMWCRVDKHMPCSTWPHGICLCAAWHMYRRAHQSLCHADMSCTQAYACRICHAHIQRRAYMACR